MTRIRSHPVVLIASHEARNGWRDGRFLLAVSVILGLLVLSLLSVIPRHRSQLQDTERLTASERDRWLNQGNKTPHGAAHFGWYLAKPIGPLAVFDEGVNTYAGVFAHLEPHDQRIFRFRPAEDLPWLRRLGTLTAAVTLQHLLPFLILVLSFGTFASPEARATGRLLMSTGVRVRNVVVGRALGTALPWLTVCAVFVAIGGLALVLAGPTRGDTFLRVALVAVAYLVYQAVFVAVSLTVSLWAPSARVALSSLLAFWVCTGFIVPAVAIEAAERLDPAPAPLAFAAAMNTERYALPPWYERLGSIERRLLRQYGKSHVDDLPVSASGVGLVEEEADQDRLLDRHFHGLFDAHERQAVHLQRAAIASPLLAIRSLSAGLAGTDVTDHIAFARAAETYRRSAVQLLNKDTAVNDLPGNRTDLGVPGITTKYYQPGRELWEKVPVFRYEPPSATAVLRDRLGAALALGLWLLAAAGACAWRAGRDIER